MPDTDVLIDFLRGHPDAVAWFDANADRIGRLSELPLGTLDGTASEDGVELTMAINPAVVSRKLAGFADVLALVRRLRTRRA